MSLYNLIIFSELWPRPTPSIEVLQKIFNEALMGSGVHDMVSTYCIASGGTDPDCHDNNKRESMERPLIPEQDNGFTFVYARDDRYYDRPITIPAQSSVLLLSGLLDPQTAPKYARFQYDSFIGSAKKLIEFPYAAHCTLVNTPLNVRLTIRLPPFTIDESHSHCVCDTKMAFHCSLSLSLSVYI